MNPDGNDQGGSASKESGSPGDESAADGALKELGPMPYNKTTAYGTGTQPGFMAVVGLVLDVFAIVYIVMILRDPQDPLWSLWIPLVFIVVSLYFWRVAAKKWRWGRQYRRITGKNPWK